MSSIIVGRTRARSQAIQVVFQAEVQSVDVFDLLEGGEYVLDDGPIDPYAMQLARGVAVNRIAIDRLVGAVSHNWNLSRMPLVDRCIMGVAIYEMFCEDGVPMSVAISEAVELSKVYGTDDSSSFVNGILGRVAKLAEANPGLPLAQLARRVAEGTAAEEAPAAAQGAEGAPGEGARAADGAAQPAEPAAPADGSAEAADGEHADAERADAEA